MSAQKFLIHSKTKKICRNSSASWGSGSLHIYEIFNESKPEEILGYAIGTIHCYPSLLNIPVSETGEIIGAWGRLYPKQSTVVFMLKIPQRI